MAYKIVRHYQDDAMFPVIIAYASSLEAAQAWCRDPETSSSTAVEPDNRSHTASHGPWFDGYEEEVTP